MAEYFITDEEFDEATVQILKYIEDTPKDQLAEELGFSIEDALPMQENVKLHVSGPKVSFGKISSRLLTNIIEGFQDVADSIANSLANARTNVGRIPTEILRQTDFQIIGFFPGSFGIEMMIEGENILNPEEALVSQSLDKFFNLLTASDDADKVFDEIAELGERTLRSYKDWLKGINDAGADLTIERKSLGSAPLTWTVDRVKLPNVLEILNNVSEPLNDVLKIEGKLSAINIRKNTFEIISDEYGIISGKGSKEAIEKYQGSVGQIITSDIIKTVTKNLSTGNEKTVWYFDYIDTN